MLLILPHSLTDNKKGIDVKTQMYRQKKNLKPKWFSLHNRTPFESFTAKTQNSNQAEIHEIYQHNKTNLNMDGVRLLIA